MRATLRRQHGVISTGQALTAGMSMGAIKHRVTTGEWTRFLPRTYRDTSTALTHRQTLMAALLWGGKRSYVSHRSAARLWGLDGFDDEVMEITVHRYLKSPVPWLVVHVLRETRHDTGTMDGLRVATVHRTLLDLGAVVDDAAVEMALECSLRRGLTSTERLDRVLLRAGGRGRPGAGVLRSVVARRPPGAAPTASALETRAVQEIRRQRLPDPHRQLEILDGGQFVARVDLAYPDVRLVVEVDSREHHSGDREWARDLERRNRIVAAGFTVMHVTHDNLADDVRALGRALGRL